MSILTSLQAEWKTKTTAEKIKTIVDAMIQVGAASIAGDIVKRTASAKKPIGRACVTLAGAGIGMALGDVACKPIDEIIDTADKLISQGKQAKEAPKHA